MLGSENQVTSKEFIELCEENKVQKIMDILKLLSPKEAESLVHAKDDEAFRNAAWYDHIEVIKLLLEFTQDSKQCNRMIHAKNDEAFRKAASMAHRGHHSKIMKLLLDLTKDNDQRLQMIHSDNDVAFRYCVGDPSTHRNYGKYNCPIGFAWNQEHFKTVLANRELIDLFLDLDIDYYENLAKSLDMSLLTAAYIAKTAQEIRETRAHNIEVLTRSIQAVINTNSELPKLPNVVCNLIAQYEGGNKLVQPSALGGSTISIGVQLAQEDTVPAVSSTTILRSDSVLTQGSTSTTPLVSGVTLISNAFTDQTQHAGAYLQQQIITQNVHQYQ